MYDCVSRQIALEMIVFISKRVDIHYQTDSKGLLLFQNHKFKYIANDHSNTELCYSNSGYVVFNCMGYCSSNSALWLITIVFARWRNHIVDGITWYTVKYTYLAKLWLVAIPCWPGETMLVLRKRTDLSFGKLNRCIINSLNRTLLTHGWFVIDMK